MRHLGKQNLAAPQQYLIASRISKPKIVVGGVSGLQSAMQDSMLQSASSMPNRGENGGLVPIKNRENVQSLSRQQSPIEKKEVKTHHSENRLLKTFSSI